MKAMRQGIRSRKALTILFLIAGVLFSTLSPASVYARQGGSESLSGWLTIIRGDSQDGQTRDITLLATDEGQSVPLLLDASVTEPLGGLLALDRKHISVTGDWSGTLGDQGGPEAFRVSSVAPLAEADVAAAAVKGAQKWISILCRFQGNTAQPKDL